MSLLIMSDSDNEIIETTRVYDEGYKAGLKDAWNAARKIDANRNVEDYVFGDDLEHGFIHISAQDVIAKIKEYEENYMIPRQNAIKSHLRNLLNEYTQSEIEAALYSMEVNNGKED